MWIDAELLKKIITEEIEYGYDEGRPKNKPSEFFEWFADKINLHIPKEYQDSAEIFIEGDIIFKYKRIETQEEYDMRMLKKKDRERFERESDMRSLENLLKKYNLALR